jgi:glycosyltransferase involved in cell wall biosynthesis
MAMGKAVVSTTVGAEGLPVQDGEHLLLADEPDSFASAVVRLLRDDETRRTLEASARRLVVEHYDWAAVAGDLDRALTRVVKGSTEQSIVRASATPAPAMAKEVHASNRAR